MIMSRSVFVAFALCLPVSSLNCTQKRYKRQEGDLNIHLCRDQQTTGGYGGGMNYANWMWPYMMMMMMYMPYMSSMMNYGGLGGYGGYGGIGGIQTVAQPAVQPAVVPAISPAITPAVTQQCIGPCVNGQCPAGYTCINNQCCRP